MKKVTRQEIFAQAAKKLRQDFAELSTIPHAGLKGGEAEELVRKFLRGHLPKRFDVGSGFIIDQKENISKQTDVIIYDALNCPVYRASEIAAIIPSDNAAAVIEAKANLDKERLREAFENIKTVKELAKTKRPELPILMTTQTLGFVFAFKSPLTLEKLAEHYAECIREVGLGRHIDAVLVLDKGIISLSAKPTGMLGWGPLIMEGLGGPASEGCPVAVGTTAMGEDSLDAFLRLLLAQLIHFRGIIGHPGFEWRSAGRAVPTSLTYLTSISHEKDAVKREELLRRYAEQVRREFESTKAPTGQSGEARPAAETPEVIHLPPPQADQSKR